MPRQRGARLPEGMTILDFRSPSAIESKLTTDAAIRAEYSRQRSIIRKRVERMKAAGETSNAFYRRFGDLEKAMPTAKGLSTKEMEMRMAASARAIGGGYQSTLEQIKAARKASMERVRDEAKAAGDTATADFLDKPLTPKQAEKVNRIWGIVKAILGRSLGKSIGSGETDVKIHQLVLEGGRSVLSMAAQVLSDYDADVQQLETLRERFTTTGKTRVSWDRAHRGKGKKK